MVPDWVITFFTVLLLGSIFYNAVRKKGKWDHSHDPNWTKEEYLNHIKTAHPDIWIKTMGNKEDE